MGKLSFCKTTMRAGFTLAEVVIAIGIVSFAALAILGLFFIGLQSSRESTEDTCLALMTQQVMAWSRAQSFKNLTAASNNVSSNPPPRFYFTPAGELSRDANGEPVTTPSPDSLYSCTISWQNSTVSTNLVFLQYRFDWPLAAPAASRQQRVIMANRANED